ncbi:hypothetical protein [Spirillospora sp. CA-128828]|uniref:hypothetical protein n=1 Tax=Spirillospora sp. CA-128828 TaxID=3240033 RepID=UPI003D8DD4DB
MKKKFRILSIFASLAGVSVLLQSTSVLFQVLDYIGGSEPPSPSPGTNLSPLPPTSGDAIKVASIATEFPTDWEEFATANSLNISTKQSEWLNRERDEDPDMYLKWMTSHGAVPVDSVRHQIVLRGNRAEPVRITGMRVLSRCQRPLAGTYFLKPSGGGGEDTVRIGFNLDKSHPIAQRADDLSASFGESYFASKTYSLKYKEEVVFQAIAITSKFYCEYRIQIDALSGDRRIRQIIDNKGRPFNVTASIARRGDTHPYKGYRTMYVGGLARSEVTPKPGQNDNRAWIQVDSKSWSG